MKLQIEKWYLNTAKSLYVMDTLLLIFFLLACAPLATGVAVHEWISFALMVPFTIHLMTHWPWIKNALGKLRKITTFPKGESRINLVWDLSLYFVMLTVIVSGVLVSQVSLPVLGLTIEASEFWHNTHHNLSNLIMPMLGIHLALHWKFIRTISKKFIGEKEQTRQGSRI